MSTNVKDKVLQYVIEHPSETENEVAAALKLDVVTVLSALIELEKEGKVKETENA